MLSDVAVIAFCSSHKRGSHPIATLTSPSLPPDTHGPYPRTMVAAPP
jgi:hypothetical protein